MNKSNAFGCSRRGWLQSIAVAAAVPLTVLGNSDLWGRTTSKSDDDDDADDDDKRYQTKIETRLIGDLTTFAGLEPLVLEGVGLVRKLSGTGGDPKPSPYRTVLMEDLKKRGYKNPNSILQSPDTALVIVRAKLPALLKVGDRLDVEIHIPESADATSLVGGELLEVRLSDKAVVGGRYFDGRPYALARGPVLASGLGVSSSAEPALLKRGRVLSGATVLKERELSIYLKNDFRSIRNSQRIADVIGGRFHHFDEHGIKKALATAMTDQRMVLKVHPRYKDNFPRYLQVIRHMAFRETAVERRVRMNRLKHDLCIPELSNSSSLQLEAIGMESLPILKLGLLAPTLECRFHSAVALSYLGDSSGLPALVESVKKERAFRVFALAAMASIEDVDAHIALKELMSEPSDETRYGAFRALWTLDRNDPFIRGERLGIREDSENHDNEYSLHVLRTSGPSLVHVTQRTRPEIVIFGADQEFTSPIYVQAGKHIMVTAQPGSTTISLARFQVGKPDLRKEVSMRVADVIRAADELGATYPDVLQLLADASKQRNLPTAIAVEKLPEAGRPYYRPSGKGPKGGSPVKIGRPNFAPNIYPEVDDPEEAARRNEESLRESNDSRSDGSMASVPSEELPVLGGNTGADSKVVKKKSKTPWSFLGGKK